MTTMIVNKKCESQRGCNGTQIEIEKRYEHDGCPCFDGRCPLCGTPQSGRLWLEDTREVEPA